MKDWSAEIDQHIVRYCSRLGRARSWWPRFVYHFTDVRNAAGILQSGVLYSRRAANERRLMVVDNASPSIIGQTREKYLDYARLYFRPRTPTQYRVEGMRPRSLRYYDGAHCAMPVFFCFHALRVLSLDDAEYSDGGMAKHRATHSGEREFFFGIPFDVVFDDRPFGEEERDEAVFRRHAEIIVLALPLDPHLAFVACRSAAERQTLLQLLPQHLRQAWDQRIRVAGSDLFFRKWTYVEKVVVPSYQPTEQITFYFNPDSEIPGPFDIGFEYQEDGSVQRRPWQGKRELLVDPFVIHVRGAQAGRAELWLDGDLAFAGRVDFGDIPF